MADSYKREFDFGFLLPSKVVKELKNLPLLKRQELVFIQSPIFNHQSPILWSSRGILVALRDELNDDGAHLIL